MCHHLAQFPMRVGTHAGLGNAAPSTVSSPHAAGRCARAWSLGRDRTLFGGPEAAGV